MATLQQEQGIIPFDIDVPNDSYPYPNPFFLSSAEEYWCTFGQTQVNALARKAAIKRWHLDENLKSISKEIGMEDSERKKFVEYWGAKSWKEPDAIRAELDEFFDLRKKAENWMERVKSSSSKQQTSRLEQYAQSAKQFLQGDTVEQEVSSPGYFPQGLGYANIPDEQ